MPKKIPMSEKREWLEDYDEGKPAAEIAKERSRALKVIKRGIEEARAERDGAAARAEIVKDALIKHQDQLMEIVNRLFDGATIQPADLELRRDKNGALSPIILSSGQIIHTPLQGVIVVLSDENTTLWGLLKEHLTRDRIWSKIKNWEKALVSYVKERMGLELAIKALIERETGLEVKEGKPMDDDTGFVYPHTLQLFNKIHTRIIHGIPDETNPHERMIASDDGFVRHGGGGSELAYCPGKQDECREALIRAFGKIPDLPEIKRIIDAESELKYVINKLIRSLEDTRLMGLIPGRCRICSRISL